MRRRERRARRCPSVTAPEFSESSLSMFQDLLENCWQWFTHSGKSAAARSSALALLVDTCRTRKTLSGSTPLRAHPCPTQSGLKLRRRRLNSTCTHNANLVERSSKPSSNFATERVSVRSLKTKEKKINVGCGSWKGAPVEKRSGGGWEQASPKERALGCPPRATRAPRRAHRLDSLARQNDFGHTEL